MDELQNIAPELSKIGRTNYFKVPDGYFDELPGKVQQRIWEEKAHKEAGIFVFLKKPVLAVSFSLILILLIITPFTISIYKTNNQQQQIAYQNLNIYDLEYYYIDEAMLIEIVSEDNSEINFSEVSIEASVLDYILENVDYETIIEEM